MVGSQFESAIQSSWLDKNKLVKTHKEWVDSGNGILYSSIAVLLTYVPSRNFQLWYFGAIIKCFTNKKYQVLMKTPDNQFGQETWDDYLGFVAACIKIGERKAPRKILWFGLTHFFIFKTQKKFDPKAVLIQYVHIWALYWVASFPILKWPMFPILWIAQRTFEPTDQSGTQLQWIFLEACYLLGINFKKHDEICKNISNVMTPYYEQGHPIINRMIWLRLRSTD